MNLAKEARDTYLGHVTRRHFLKSAGAGFGALAFASLGATSTGPRDPLTSRGPHFTPCAKRVIFLHMAGGPSPLELFDYKPELARLHGQDCPESLLEGKRFAFIRGIPKMLGPQATFQQHGESGAWISNHMPYLGQVADKVAFLKAMHTDEFNHAPAQLLVHSGSPRLGRPSMGSWVTYGLGTENDNLPGFVVLLSGGTAPDAGASVYGSGFLPTVYQGVQCRTSGDPVLFLGDPDGVPRSLRRKSIDAINTINRQQHEEVRDPEILTRIAQYEMAFRMQTSVPDAMDISREPAYIHEMYGTEPGETAFSNNCLLARRLVERGVRFVQLFHWGWDSHGAGESESLTGGFIERCQETDRPVAALLNDLEQRGLLEETLVIWGGEFGRTPMLENRTGSDNPFVGRDHHSDVYTMWMAGGGVKGGVTHGETDEIGYSAVSGRVHVHDLQATILHLLGFDHLRLTYPFQGRDFRLTDVHGHVVHEVLA
ncbi:MAG: DUF1501 domain-containing protein [Rhodothermaceae bacterium]|nr:DUF1501 domain-containing protein [Rhodothermaceae bacterium]MYG68891.1 DUF1501 domain-containing protein [Rhodothermaceae bacterium]MYJ44138.1 DUF1501 domain-containing protein [Rhodothermaceae bacterium]